MAERHGIELMNETGLFEMLTATDLRSDSEMMAIVQDELTEVLSAV